MPPPDAHRLILVGGSGSGTSTLGRALARALGVVHFEADDWFHAPTDPPYLSPRTPEARKARLEVDLADHGAWVISGGVMGWGVEVDPTLAVLLDLPPAIRLERLKTREEQRFGARITPGGDMYEAHRAFMTWAAGYDDGTVEGKTKPAHEAWLKTLPCPTLTLDATRPVAVLVSEVLTGRLRTTT